MFYGIHARNIYLKESLISEHLPYHCIVELLETLIMLITHKEYYLHFPHIVCHIALNKRLSLSLSLILTWCDVH